jgi:hypothetical protein
LVQKGDSNSVNRRFLELSVVFVLLLVETVPEVVPALLLFLILL